MCVVHQYKETWSLCCSGCTGASIHGRDPTTEWQGGFDLLSLRLGPVHPTLDDLVVPGCPRRTISIPNLAWMPDQHSPRQLRASELNRSSSLSPLGLGLQVWHWREATLLNWVLALTEVTSSKGLRHMPNIGKKNVRVGL